VGDPAGLDGRRHTREPGPGKDRPGPQLRPGPRRRAAASAPPDYSVGRPALGPQIPSLIAAGTLSANVPPDFGYVTDAAQKVAQEKLAGRLGKFPARPVGSLARRRPQGQIDTR
jgi:hypothetical protein